MTTISQHLNICVPCLHMPSLERYILRCYLYECTFIAVKFLAVPYYHTYKLCSWLQTLGWAITFQWINLCHHNRRGFYKQTVNLCIKEVALYAFSETRQVFPLHPKGWHLTVEVALCCYLANINLILIHNIQHSISSLSVTFRNCIQQNESSL